MVGKLARHFATQREERSQRESLLTERWTTMWQILLIISTGNCKMLYTGAKFPKSLLIITDQGRDQKFMVNDKVGSRLPHFS